MFNDLLVRKTIDQLMKDTLNTRDLKRILEPLNLTIEPACISNF